MNSFFTKTFFKFFFVFLIIIGVAFGVMLLTASRVANEKPVDNIALPQ